MWCIHKCVYLVVVIPFLQLSNYQHGTCYHKLKSHSSTVYDLFLHILYKNLTVIYPWMLSNFFTQCCSSGDTSFLLQIWSGTVVVTMSRPKKIFETQLPTNKSILIGENGTIDGSGQSLCTGKIEYFYTENYYWRLI